MFDNPPKIDDLLNYCSPILGNLYGKLHIISQNHPKRVPDRRDHACSNGGTPSARSSGTTSFRSLDQESV